MDSVREVLESSGRAIPGGSLTAVSGGGGRGTPNGGSLHVGYGVQRSTQRALLQSLTDLVELFEQDPDSVLPKVPPH